MWAIITTETEGTMYLAWQTPVTADDNGYFWTSKKVINQIRKNSTPEHPFLFRQKIDAIKLLKDINIPQQCKIVSFGYKPRTNKNSGEVKETKQYTVEPAYNENVSVEWYENGIQKGKRVMYEWEADGYCKALEEEGYTKAYDLLKYKETINKAREELKDARDAYKIAKEHPLYISRKKKEEEYQ